MNTDTPIYNPPTTTCDSSCLDQGVYVCEHSSSASVANNTREQSNETREDSLQWCTEHLHATLSESAACKRNQTRNEPEIRTALKSYLNLDFNAKLDAYLNQ